MPDSMLGLRLAPPLVTYDEHKQLLIRRHSSAFNQRLLVLCCQLKTFGLIPCQRGWILFLKMIESSHYLPSLPKYRQLKIWIVQLADLPAIQTYPSAPGLRPSVVAMSP